MIQLHAHIDFDTYSRNFFKHSTKKQLLSKSCSPDWYKEICCCDDKQSASLVFTAPDMNKNGQNPDTSFNNVYTDKNFSIQAWSMLASHKAQQEISLLFGIPDDYDVTKSSTITLYLLVQGKENTATANIEISLDSKSNDHILGPNFVTTISTGNFIVTEPTDNKDVRVLVVQATIPPQTLSTQSLIVFVFSRIAPTGQQQEYKKDIYLESITITYATQDV